MKKVELTISNKESPSIIPSLPTECGVGLTMSQKYLSIMQEFFPNGIDLSSPEQINSFVAHYQQSFNANYSPIKRTVSTRIAECCIQRDKNIYIKPRSELNNAKALNKILKYIVESDDKIFITSALYTMFEDDLRANGIDNHYFLKGILKNRCKQKLYFKRNYITKDEGIKTVYDEVYDFIRMSNEPIRKTDLLQAFPNLPLNILNMVVSDELIINLYGSYIHKYKLGITDRDRECIFNTIERMVSDGKIHHSERLLTILTMQNREMVDRLAIDTQYKMFSIIKAFFAESFSMQRPYFAKKDAKIGHGKELIKEFIFERNMWNLSEILDFAKEQCITIKSIIELINSYNDCYLFVDRENIWRIEQIGVNDFVAKFVEELILKAMQNNDFITLTDFPFYDRLPRLATDWNEWLVYSVIKKYSAQLEAITTKGQLKKAEIVLVKKAVNIKTVSELLKYIQSKKGFNELELLRYAKLKGLIE